MSFPPLDDADNSILPTACCLAQAARPLPIQACLVFLYQRASFAKLTPNINIVFDNASRGGGPALVSKASRCGFPSYVMARGAGAWQPHSEQYVSGLERGRRRLGQS